MPSELANNIWKLLLLKSVRWFLLVIAVLVVFFQSVGLSMTEIMILQAFFAIVVVICEVPSGYYADVYGRKNSLVMGSIFTSLGFLLYCLVSGFVGFIWVEIFLGIGISFISGSDSAMLYDTLIELKREDEYVKLEGMLFSITGISEGVASVIGGFLASINMQLPFYLQAGIILLTVPISMSLIEPARQKFTSMKGSFSGILSIVKYAMIEHKIVKWLILYSSLIGASTLTLVWFIQPYFEIVGLPLYLFGVAWAILQFTHSIVSKIAYKIENFVGKRLIIYSFIPMVVIGYFLIGSIYQLWGLGILFIFYFVRGLSNPTMVSYINSLVSSDRRATILSLNSLLVRLIFSVIGPVIGWIMDLKNISLAMMAAGLFFGVNGFICLFFLRRHKVI